tara:strand:- start:1604 stop:2245 length:642 start_codon:yes stop_codon:yes gene_type:complete
MTPAERLSAYIAEGRLVRNAWTGTGTGAEGRETACLLAAMSPDVARARDAGACPAEIMPAWLAHLTPWMDDAGSVDAWPAMVRRYASLASRWHVLSPAAWDRLDYRCRLIAVEEAGRQYDHAAFPTVAAAVERVRELLVRAVAGGHPSAGDWTAATAEAWARAAAEAAAVEALDAGAVDAGAVEAATRAATAVADRITAAMLDAVEDEIQEAT